MSQQTSQTGSFVKTTEFKDIRCPKEFAVFMETTGNRPLSEAAKKLALHRSLIAG